MRRHWLPLALVALHPAGAVANVMDAEPFELAAVVAVEGLLLGALAAWTLPDQQNEPAPTEPDHDLRIDGFAARWPVHPGLNTGESVVASIVVGSVAAAGAVVWLALTFPYNRGFPNEGNLTLLLVSALFAGVVGLIQAACTVPTRFVIDLVRQREQVQVILQGRELIVGTDSWRLHDEDRYEHGQGEVILGRGGNSLRIPAPAGAARWLLPLLEQARPAPDDGTVPAALQALRADDELA